MAGFTLAGREWPFVIGSDVIRDGMYLEVQTPDGEIVFEIFYSDQTNLMTVGAFQDHLPFDVVEAALQFAKYRLTPTKD